MTRSATATLVFAALLGAAPHARAQEVVFTVGGDKAKGKAAAEASGGKWAKSLTKGFKELASKVGEGKPGTYVLRVAAGDHDGDLGSGAYELPSLRNKDAVVRLEGGWDDAFQRRDPFGAPSRIVTTSERSLPLFNFYNSRNPNVDQDVLEALVLDGLLFDVGNSNNYDKQSNSLLMRGTCTFPIIRFRNLMVNHFEVRSCVFLNSPHRVFETLVRPGGAASTMRLFTNVFLNCIIPVKMVHALTKGKMFESMVVDHCSFILCWPAQPDVNTGNPAILELSDDKYTKRYEVTNNLFYGNFGAALYPLGRMPKVKLDGNLFTGNGLYWGSAKPGAGAMVVDAGGKKNVIDVDTIEDLDFIDSAEGNVSIPPALPLTLPDAKPADASGVKADDSWQNDLNRVLGRNVQGGKVKVQDFAPRKEYDPKNPPFPRNPAAKRYGASPELVGAK